MELNSYFLCWFTVASTQLSALFHLSLLCSSIIKHSRTAFMWLARSCAQTAWAVTGIFSVTGTQLIISRRSLPRSLILSLVLPFSFLRCVQWVCAVVFNLPHIELINLPVKQWQDWWRQSFPASPVCQCTYVCHRSHQMNCLIKSNC